MKGIKKWGIIGVAAILVVAIVVGIVVWSGSSGNTSGDDGVHTYIDIAQFGGGIGRKWLDEACERFAKKVENVSFEEGRKGVKFDITHAIGVNCKEMHTQGHHIFFLQSKYSDCYNEIVKGHALDLTDMMTVDTLDDYGDAGVTIESKINADYRFAMKGSDGKYYMLPHYEFQSGASYDVDQFVKYSLYLAKEGEGDDYYCELTGKTYYFTGTASEKTVGNDGIAGTDDDGMPTTLDELVAMCDHIKDNGIIPFDVPGSHIDYSNYLVDGLWTALAGFEQRNAVVSHQGKVDYVTGFSDEEVWSGTGIKYPIIETVTINDSIDGYKAINSAARYYSFAFFELAYKQGWIYDQYKISGFDHKQAMRAFVLNGLSGQPKISAHIEGSYWYNECRGYNIFNDYKIFSGTGSEVKNIGYWHMPTAYGKDAEVVTGLDNKREEAAINGTCSTIMVNGNIAENPGRVKACKEFLKFLASEQELQNFTACTGVAKALYNYNVNSDYVIGKLDPYQQTVMRFRAANRVVHQYGDNPTYRNKANVMTYSISAEGFHPVFDGVTYNAPLEAYWKKNKTAQDCFIETGFSATAWESEVYKAAD